MKKSTGFQRRSNMGALATGFLMQETGISQETDIGVRRFQSGNARNVKNAEFLEVLMKYIKQAM